MSIITAWTAAGWSPSQVLQKLQSDLPPDEVPNIRTIERVMKEDLTADLSDPWTPASAAGNLAAISEVLGEVIDRTDARVHRLSEGEAEWVERVHGIAPDAPPWQTYLLAREYVLRTGKGEPTTDLDGLLALAPWRRKQLGWQRYKGLVEQGFPGVPGHIVFEWIFQSILGGRSSGDSLDPAMFRIVQNGYLVPVIDTALEGVEMMEQIARERRAEREGATAHQNEPE